MQSTVRHTPRVVIVVLNWNGSADTLACLKSLERVEYPSFRVILVDNGSTDGSLDLVRREPWHVELEIIETGANLGYAGGNNVGIRRAVDSGCEFVFLLNNDTVVASDLLDHLVAAAERWPSDGAFGPLIFYTDRPDTIWFAGGRWNADSLRFEYLGQDQRLSEFEPKLGSTDYVCGAAMFLRSSAISRIGLLDTRFFLVYEESDWCFRARRAGIQCRMVQDAHVWHKVGASFGAEVSPLRVYYSMRNQLLWAERNLPLKRWLTVLMRSTRRLIPTFSFDRKGSSSLIKRIVWGLAQHRRDWARRWRDPYYRALQLGVRDYALRRFGMCPRSVWALQEKWKERESVHTT